MASGSFKERGDPDGNPAELFAYQEEGLAPDLTREELVVSMEELLRFTRGQTFEWEDDFGALIFGTVARSGRTFEGICLLLNHGLAVQAAMLCRSLFEDMIVGHWLFYNLKDHDWMVEKFLRQREAIGLHQRNLQKETGWGPMGPPIPIADGAGKRAKALFAEFSGEVTRDWWNPGKSGKGEGGDVKMRKVVGLLEDAADKHELFHPRFAGGAEKLLRNTELTVNKWFNQCVHHTTIGLPFSPTHSGVEKAQDPMILVCFSATWIFAQQIYLAHDVSGRPAAAFQAYFWEFMLEFSKVMDPGETEIKKLEEQFDQILAELEREATEGAGDASERPR